MSALSENTKVVSKIELFKAWAEAQRVYSGQPGLSVGVVYDQEIVWAQGFGVADVETQTPTTAASKYRVASISKLFTATAVMQLRDAGKLRLDDPVSDHLPWFEVQNKFPDAPPITIQHLLTHTSGLPREAAFPYWSDTNFPTAAQIRETLPSQETALPTETKWKYSNLALSLAGEVITAVSGEPYIDYIHSHVLEPLGMNDSSMAAPDPADPQLATGYGRRLPDGSRALSPYTDCRGITAAANLTTTVNDLAQFAMLQFRDGTAGGAQILRGSTLREMHRVHWLNPDWKGGWGLGFMIVRGPNDETFVEHGGALQGYRTQIRLNPAAKVGAIVLTNSDDGNPLKYVEKLYEWVVPAVLEAAQPAETAAVAEPQWARYVGKYRSAWGDWQVLVQEGQLVLLNPSLIDPLPGLNTLEPVSEHTFRMHTDMGTGSDGELAVFEMDGDGRVVKLRLGMNDVFPIEAW